MSDSYLHAVRRSMGALLRTARALARPRHPEPEKVSLAARNGAPDRQEPVAPEVSAPQAAPEPIWAPQAPRCAFCGQLTSTDGGRLKVHFARVTDARPCWFSYRQSTYPFSR
jgi:hypothetical protein